jgi:DNA-binding HxlR family transcriptional regulator/putative sterol carrier protein
MKTYGEYCPIAKSVEVLGERWSILVLRELLFGSTKFNDISRGLPTMSRTMLSKRLREFETAGLIEKLDGGYHLTPAGQDLRGIVFDLGKWGETWVLGTPDPEELDPDSLFWHAHARFDISELPDRRVVIAFVLDDRPERYWVVVEAAGCSVCEADPGYDIDVVVRASADTFYKVWYHHTDLRDAVRSGAIRIEGDSAMTRRIPKVIDLLAPDLCGVDASSPRPVWRT